MFDCYCLWVKPEFFSLHHVLNKKKISLWIEHFWNGFHMLGNKNWGIFGEFFFFSGIINWFGLKYSRNVLQHLYATQLHFMITEELKISKSIQQEV